MRGLSSDVFRSMVRARNLVNLLLVLLLVAAADVTIPSPAAAVSLGSYPGLTALAPNDDSSSGAVPLGFTLSFFGHDYSSVYVNNNGNVTFDSPQGTYTPYGLSSTTRVIIAPFFADVDTRTGGTVSYGTIDYGGRVAFCVQWRDVGYYSGHNDKTNSFELILVDRSDVSRGDFDAVFRYERIQWETGDASGGSGGFGGASATVGYANGSGMTGTFFDQEGSGVNGSLLDSGPNALVSAGSSPGVLLFHLEPGSLAAPYQPPSSSVTEPVKPTIVLIGGLWSDYGPDGGASGQTWHGTALDLRDRGYTVLIPPMRAGHPSTYVMDSMGDIQENAARLDAWLADTTQHPEEAVTPGTQVVLVGHSMGGLIARAFASSRQGLSTSQVEVVGIYQIDTPNLGSPLAALGSYLPFVGLGSAAFRELAQPGVYINLFNLVVAPTTEVPTRHVKSDFFPDSATAQVDSNWLSLTRVGQLLVIDVLKKLYLGVPNDGLVSTQSASFDPDWWLPNSLHKGSLLVHAVHGKGIFGLKDLWSHAECMPPERGTKAGSAMFPDLAKFLAQVSASAAASLNSSSSRTTASMSQSRPALATLELDALSPTDLDSASGWTTCAQDEVGLSSGSTALVPFSVGADGALISVSTDAGTPTVSVVDSDGAPVDCETTSASGQTMGVISCAAGQYVARIGLSGADTATASINVTDAGASELRVSAPAQAAAGSDFTVEAGIYENAVRQTGDIFTASAGGDSVLLRDDGLAPDSVAGDGVFSGTLTAPASGTADVIVNASGSDIEGTAFTRVAHALVTVAVPRARLSGPFTWRTTTGTSGKADALLFDVGVHASQDCTLRVAGTVTSGSTVAQPGTVVTLSAGSDATVTLTVSPDELETFDASGAFALSSVDLLDMTDQNLTAIDSATPALTGTLAPSDVEYSACSIGLEGSAPTNTAPVELAGEAVSTTTTIAGVELSFDDGTTWYQAPAPDAGWGSNDELWSCAFILPEGEFGVTAQALDENGDPIPGARSQCSFAVDRTAPTTTATVDPSGWSKQATITLAADDGTGSGVAQTLYSVDGGPEQAYAGPFTVATESAQVTFSSTDLAGNQEATEYISPQVDTTAPSTTDNTDGSWHKAPVTVALTPTDNAGGSGMSGGDARTEYKLDSGDWTTGTSVTVTAPASHANDGSHTISYRSSDAAGNVEADKTCTVKIDTTPPAGSFTLNGGAATTTTPNVTVGNAVSDANGVSAMRFSTDGKASWSGWASYAASESMSVPGGDGAKTVWGQYRDPVGNVFESSASIILATPAPTPTPTPPISPEITLKLSGLKHGAIKHGKRLTAKGVVTPTSLAGSRLTLTAQLKKGRKWVKAKTAAATISSAGAYSWKYKPRKKGTYRLRGTIAKTADHVAAKTAWRSFKVK